MSAITASTLPKPHGYPLYKEIVEFLEGCRRLYPGLCHVYPVGKSYLGRDILCCELTADETGPGTAKPAYYIDANHHAGEVTGAATALYTIWYLLTNYGTDEQCTRLLREQVFYIIPRIAVDASDVYLTTPETMRSSLRPYPETEVKPGLYPDDIDDDGHILVMRVKDASGPWKVSDKDARLMVRRAPGETGGTYYRLYTEGLIREFAGVEIKAAPPKWGIDLNRNYPGTWQPEAVQPGAGPYPASEPEVRTVVEFMAGHPNIVGAMSYHTSGGMILRSHCARPDEKLPRADLQAMKRLGEIGMRWTGYPTWSIYEEFTVDKDRPPIGSWMDWAYDLSGILPMAIELWDMAQHAGLPKRTPKENMELTLAEQEANGLALLRWNDRVMAGRCFTNWREFAHPQLGTVELGGWLPKTAQQNPPVELLEGECHRCAMFTLEHAAMAPRLVVESFAAEEVGAAVGTAGATTAATTGAGAAAAVAGGDRKLYRLTAVLNNVGYLPTNVTQQALASHVAKPIKVSVAAVRGGSGAAAGAGVTWIAGKPKDEVGQLPGHGSPTGMWGFFSPETRKKLEWVVAAEPGTKLLLTAGNPKCGTATAEAVLE